ncbi:MAG: hypothetical protein IKA13_01870 [Bacteroidales bacterium]|nr:hypothetical protein [Bacteroidales bacterium]
MNRLNWFIDEQVEEEESARDMIAAVEADCYLEFC